MRKIIKISNIENTSLSLLFDNDEEKSLNLEAIFDDKFALKILSDYSLLQKAEIGEFGEIFGKDAAEIVGLDGKTEKCNYDISPEFAYYHSKQLFL